MEIELKPKTLKRAVIIFGVIFAIDVILELLSPGPAIGFLRFIFLWYGLSLIGLYIFENKRRKFFWIYLASVIAIWIIYIIYILFVFW